MMKKEHFILLILILTIFITGCNGSSFLGSGPNGVQILFIQPESTITSRGIDEGSSVPIELELTNYAECNIIGTLCVKDTLSDVYGGISEQCKNINFEESRTNNNKLELDKQTYIFTSQPYTNLFKDQETNLQATAKYSCDIIVGPKRVCTQSPFENDETKCKNFETISGSALSSRVAPITVGSIDKQLFLSGDNDIKLKTAITFKKMSKGKVSIQNENQESNLKGNPIKIDVDYAGSQMTCTGRDYKDGILSWKSSDTEKIINCEILLNTRELQENPLNIRLDYIYEITESKLIKINHIEKEGA